MSIEVCYHYVLLRFAIIMFYCHFVLASSSKVHRTHHNHENAEAAYQSAYLYLSSAKDALSARGFKNKESGQILRDTLLKLEVSCQFSEIKF